MKNGPLFTTIEVDIFLLEVQGVKTILDKLTIIRLKEAGRSNRSIAKELEINRKTVGHYWNQHLKNLKVLEAAPDSLAAKDKLVSAPTYDTTKRSPRKYTPEIDKRLDEIILSEIEKNRQLGPHKQRMTAIGIFELIQSEGFDIGRSTITAHVREKLNRHKEAFIKQQYALGYRVEFDFGEVKLRINNELKTYMLAVFSAPASGYRWAKLYESANQQVFLDAHTRFFNQVSGVYETVVYDNMRNVIKKFVGRNEKELNDELVKLALFYGFTPVVTNAFSGNEKGHVEQSVKHIRNKAFTKVYAFDSLHSAQEHLDAMLVNLNEPSQIDEERRYLAKKYSDFEHSIISTHSVSKYSFISLGRNFNSVPDYLVGKEVTVKKYLSVLRVIYQGNFICEHQLIQGKGQYQIDIKHYLKTLSRKPKALEHSLVLQSLPDLYRCFRCYYQSEPKRFIQLLEVNQNKPLPEIIVQLRKERLLTRDSTKRPLPSKAVDAARGQVQAYTQLHLERSSR